jgi:glycosyltransferase involved in cell wall biosynthesis
MNGVRLLHVVGQSRYGGGVQVILPVAAAARERGWRVGILTSDPQFQREIQAAGVEVVDLDIIRRSINPYYDLRDTAKLVSLLRREPYTIVHTHTSKGGMIGRLAASLAGVPVVVHTVHGFAFDDSSSPAAKLVYGTLERVASRGCDSVVTVSQYHRELALRRNICAPDKVVAVPNGLDAARSVRRRPAAEVRRELGIADELIVLCPVRIAASKGLEYLIQSVGGIRARIGGRFRILIAGEGTLRPSLEALAAATNAGANLCFLGFRSDLGDLLGAADLVVLPTLFEGLSISLLEAMSAGKPVITTAIPSNVEVLGPDQAGVLVPVRDPAAIAEAVARLAADPALAATLGRRAMQVWRRSYTGSRMVAAYMNLYDELLERKEVRQECLIRTS